MLDLMYEYADAEEKQATVFCEACEIAMDRALLALDTFTQMADLRARAAEVKYVMEDGEGSVEALMNYYEESGASKAASGTQKKNLIVKAWEAILNFLTSIINKIKSILPKKKLQKEEAQVPKWVQTVADAANKVKSKIGTGGKIAIGAALVGTGLFVARKLVLNKNDKETVKMNKATGNKLIALLTTVLEAIKKPIGSLISKLKGGKEEDPETAESRGLIKTISQWIRDAIDKIFKCFSAGPDKNGEQGESSETDDEFDADGNPIMHMNKDERHDSAAEDEPNDDDIFGENMLDDFGKDDEVMEESADDEIPDYFNEDGSIDIDALMAGL